MDRILLITEKPGLSENVLKGLSNVVLNGKKIDTVFVYPISWWQWKVPKKTPLRKIPHTPSTEDMTLKLNPMMDSLPYASLNTDDGDLVVGKRAGYTTSELRKILLDRWNEYESVICIPGNDRNGWGSLIRWFRWLAEIDETILIGKDIRCLMPKDFSIESVEKSFHEACSLNSDHIAEMSRQFEFKHVFDAWFNMNAATVFGIAQKKAGVENPDLITKYEIMTLHAIEKIDYLNLQKHEILQGMQHWCGTGSYKRKVSINGVKKEKFACLAFEEVDHKRENPEEYKTVGIGSDMSRQSIIDKLIAKKMLQEKNDVIKVTDLGKQFLVRCHFGTFDPDLPFRIEKWIKNDDINSVKRYIRRYFSRQKRYVM